MAKRVISAIVGIAVLIFVFIFNNVTIMNIALTLVALLALA